jgi:mannose-6-phosphate isomerase-like protein (cupin superfamily)
VAKDAIVSDDLAQKFASEKETPYTRWVRAEGLEIISSFYVPDLHTVELKPWARRGGRGVFLNHDASRTSNDCYVCEIPPGKELAPQHQLYEEMIYVLDGRGSTDVWNEAGQRTTFEWKAGALFAIPLNAWHQHFNGSGIEPARYVAVTNAAGHPQRVRRSRIRLQHPLRLHGSLQRRAGVLRQPRRAAWSAARHQFRGRRGEPAAHHREGTRRGRIAHPFQHGEGAHEQPYLAVRGGALQEGARARTGAHVIIMGGEGYSLMWPEGAEPRRYEWRKGR